MMNRAHQPVMGKEETACDTKKACTNQQEDRYPTLNQPKDVGRKFQNTDG